MSMQHPREVGHEHVVARYVAGERRYLELLGGNFLRLGEEERTAFVGALQADSLQVSDQELRALLAYEWRSRLTAAWLVGVARRVEWRERIGSLLLASELTYTGQGYCFALSRFGSQDDANILASYLYRYLPQLECRYDQGPALGALMRLDSQLGTSHSARFVAPDGLWERWVDALPHTRGTATAWADSSRAAIDAWCGPWEA